MDWNQVEGAWKEFKGMAKEQWGNLTDDELDRIAGKRDRLVGEVQRKHGLSLAEAEEAVSGWVSNLRKS